MPKKNEKQDEPILISYKDKIQSAKSDETSMLENNKHEITEREIASLKKSEYNPRKISKKQREALKDGMQKFGFLGHVIINKNPERKDVIIGGHQRLDIWKELGYKTIQCIEVDLSLEEEKELNIRLNKNGGEFDENLLNEFFNFEDLLSFGFSAKELPNLDELDDNPVETNTEEEEPLYPIVPKFNEKYSMFCIMTSHELDETWVKNVLQLFKMASYKSSVVAPSFVISCEDFKKAINEYAENLVKFDKNDKAQIMEDIA